MLSSQKSMLWLSSSTLTKFSEKHARCPKMGGLKATRRSRSTQSAHSYAQIKKCKPENPYASTHRDCHAKRHCGGYWIFLSRFLLHFKSSFCQTLLHFSFRSELLVTFHRVGVLRGVDAVRREEFFDIVAGKWWY